MKKCAKCGAEYEEKYDGCPECEKGAQASPPQVKGGNTKGCLALILAIVGIAVALSMRSSGGPSDASSTADNPALAAKAQTALENAGGDAVIHDVFAYGTGDVVVTLNLTTDAMGGKVLAQDAAQGVAGAVLSGVPEASDVMVYDSDKSVIGTYSR